MNILRVTLSSGTNRAGQSWQIAATGRLEEADVWNLPTFPGAPRLTLVNASAEGGSWTLTLPAESAWTEDVIAEVQIGLSPEESPHMLFWPRYTGTLEQLTLTSESSGEFRGAGRPAYPLPPEERLALPLVITETPKGTWLAGTDPLFSTTMSVRHENGGYTWVIFSWKWLAQAAIHINETRRLFVQPVHDVSTAFDRWFLLATPDVPAGPAWLHEIALQDYDYFSKDGQGWYADVDAVCKMIVPQDRHRALFCLHGSYDRIGRYCYDTQTGQLDEKWEVFSQIQHPTILTHTINTPVQNLNLPTPAALAFRNLERYHPMPFSWQDVRDRLRYARERGLRTAVYALTGLQGAGAPDLHVADGTGLGDANVLWQGPDLVGPTYLMNPLHPMIRARILGYIQAPLEQVGDLTDALVMDEAYFVGYGTLGPLACLGYADRAQFSLIQEITALCHHYRPDLAFLTADLLGHPSHEKDAFPYSLAADGIYQDSWCVPQTWDCVRFPSWRNVAWSCNWAPVTNLAFTRWAVQARSAPIAISNGCFGDDTGLAAMKPEIVTQIADLWRGRIRQTRARPLVLMNTSEAAIPPI